MRLFTLFLFALLPVVQAATLYVSPAGDDAANGQTRETAFATIQRGVEALAAGDTLLIAPGEYLGSVSRQGLGSDEVDTVIRAETPGTVRLRGDVPVGGWRKLPGYRFVYVTDFRSETPIQVVNELDTLSVLYSQPSLPLLEMAPGSFHYDAGTGQLYVSSSDLTPVPEHRYSVSVNTSHGFYLDDARRVAIEGLLVSGFNAAAMVSRLEGTMGATYGIFLNNSRRSVVRHCQVYLNGCGIGLHSGGDEDGRNLIEHCRAWANATRYGWGDKGGINIHGQRRGNWETIRHCESFFNHVYGINIYAGDGPQELDEERRNRLMDSLAWGNEVADFKIKTGGTYSHRVIRGVGPGLWSVIDPVFSLLGRQTYDAGADSIELADFPDLDPDAEFADPLNLDYRLQATSRFRGAGPDGRDQGPFPYRPELYFLSPSGDDAAEGRSVSTAWRTLVRAAEALSAGDTLYLLAGRYALPAELSLPPDVSLWGRGDDDVVLTGSAEIKAERLSLRRLRFADLELPMDEWFDPRAVQDQIKTLPQLVGPFLHSTSATTANIEWWTAVPGRFEVTLQPAAGETASQQIDSAQAGNLSFTGLHPGTRYSVRLAGPHGEKGELVFTTATEDRQPITWYVAPDGDDAASGTSRGEAWRTVQHAARQVGPGDTVLIAGGTYHEAVRLHATGTPDAPITFRAMPGEKVVFDGLDRSLGYVFLATHKSHLRFDGLYFRGYEDHSSLMPWAHHTRGLNGAIVLYHSVDVAITRCFQDGRGLGYSCGLLFALHSRDITVRNCVVVRTMSGAISFASTPDLRVENSLFLVNLISVISEGMNAPDQPFSFRRNVVSDSIHAKFHVNCFDIGAVEAMDEGDNCYYLRGPDAERRMWQFYGTKAFTTAAAAYRMDPAAHPASAITELTRLSHAEYEQQFAGGPTGSVFRDPGFPAAEGLPELDSRGQPHYFPDSLLSKEDLDFPDLFVTDPEMRQRGIGLDPAAFEDFHFNR